jgi:hypothetical protein
VEREAVGLEPELVQLRFVDDPEDLADVFVAK